MVAAQGRCHTGEPANRPALGLSGYWNQRTRRIVHGVRSHQEPGGVVINHGGVELEVCRHTTETIMHCVHSRVALMFHTASDR